MVVIQRLIYEYHTEPVGRFLDSYVQMLFPAMKCLLGYAGVYYKTSLAPGWRSHSAEDGNFL